MEKVMELVSEIRQNITQVSPSQKDEVRVMRAMLNDREYKVDLYSKDGVVGQYCPAEDVRGMLTNVISSAAKIPQQEAEKLASVYEFKKSDAVTMIDLSKEFINTYVQTGRKLPLGARETSNVSLSRKHVDAGKRPFPKKIGVNADGTGRYDRGEAQVNAYDSVKVHAPCPEWVK